MLASKENPIDTAIKHLKQQGMITHLPYYNILQNEVWDKIILAKVVECYFQIETRPSSEWDEVVQNLSERIGSYVQRYRPRLLDQMSYEEVAAKIATMNTLAKGYGTVGIDYSYMDLKMFRMKKHQPIRFQEYLNDFEICLSSKLMKQAMSVKSEDDASLDCYETAKLIELCSHPYKTKDMRALVQHMRSYADERGVEDKEGLRSVYELNRRTSYIMRLLSPGNGEKQGTLPLERELTHMYLERPQEFRDLIAEANQRMGIEIRPPIGEEAIPSEADTIASPVEPVTYTGEPTREVIAEDSLARMDEERLRCSKVLEEFPNGVDLNSPLDTDKFCHKYEDLYGGLPDSGESGLLKLLERVGEKRDGRIFPAASREKKELLKDIATSSKRILDEGYSCVYLEQMYDKYRSELGKEGVYGVEELSNLLRPKINDGYVISGGRLLKLGKKADLGGDVLSYLKLRGAPVSINEIAHDLWYLPMKQIRQGINTTREIINTAPQTFMAAEIFPVNQDDLEQISILLDKALASSFDGQLKDEELRSIIEHEMPNLAIDTAEYTLKAFHCSLGYWLDWIQNKFHFEGRYVAKSQTDLRSVAEHLQQFCEDHEQFTMDEISDFAKENNVNNLWYYYDVIRKKSLRISKEEFVRFDQVQFDIEAIDAKLEQFCSGDYTPLKTVKNFMLLPMATGANWSHFLLESYLYGVSKKFSLAHARFLDSDCIGAMVKKGVQFESYDDLLADALAKNDCWKNENEALDYLVDAGYLGRARYGKIAELMKNAKSLRDKPPAPSKSILTPESARKDSIKTESTDDEVVSNAAVLADDERTIFYCKHHGMSAMGYVSNGGFTVVKGSRVAPEMMYSARQLKGLRDSLEDNGTIVNCIFQKNFEFSSPSTAARIVTGRAANGNVAWKTKDGSPFGDFGIKIQRGNIAYNYRNSKKNYKYI